MSNRTDKINTLIPYTSQDYNSILESQKETLGIVMPEYTDKSDSDFGMGLLEVIGKAFDVLSWKVDVAMNEAIPTNSVYMKSILGYCKWIGYKPRQNKQAKGTFRFTVVNDGYEFIIPAGTRICSDRVGDEKSVVFETSKTLVAKAPDECEIGHVFTLDVEATHGESVEEYLGVSNGLMNQTFKTTYTPYVSDSMTLKCVNRKTNITTFYDESENFIDMLDNEQKFVLTFDEDGIGTIEFGDGTNGSIPPEGCDIYALYKIGGGEVGNKTVNSISILNSEITEGRIESVTNITPTTGGEDAETVSDIQRNAPRSSKVRNRLVTADDFEDYTKISYDGVGSCKMKKNTTYVDTYDLYVAPKDISKKTVDSTTKQRIKSDLESKCIMGMVIDIHDPVIVPIKIALEVYYTKLYTPDVIESSIRYELIDMFASQSFNGEISISDIYELVYHCEGVRKIKVTALHKKSEGSALEDVKATDTQILFLENPNLDITITPKAYS